MIEANNQISFSFLGHGHDGENDANAASNSAENVRQEAQVDNGNNVEETTLGRLERRSVVTSRNGLKGTNARGGGGVEHGSSEDDGEDDPNASVAGVEDIGAKQHLSLSGAASKNTEATEEHLENIDNDTKEAQAVPHARHIHVVHSLEHLFSVVNHAIVVLGVKNALSVPSGSVPAIRRRGKPNLLHVRIPVSVNTGASVSPVDRGTGIVGHFHVVHAPAVPRIVGSHTKDTENDSPDETAANSTDTILNGGLGGVSLSSVFKTHSVIQIFNLKL